MLARIRALASRILASLSPHGTDQDFERELETHLEMLTEDYRRRGLAPEEAARSARIRLGGLTQLQETNRELRGLPLVETLRQDTSFAFRMLRRNPGFAAVVVLTLALGIGANTVIFSVVHAVLLKPLPYPHAEQLFNVFQAQPRQGITGTGWSHPNFADLREQTAVFSEMAGVQQHQLTLTTAGEPSVVNTVSVTPEFFALFGEPPLAGRGLRAEDGKAGAPPVVVLGETLWRGRFGAAPGLIGATIDLDQRPFTVVGIMPATFRFPQLTDGERVWIPVAHDPLFGSWMPERSGHWLQVTGRLKPGVSPTQARAELEAIGERLAQSFPAENDGWAIRMVPLQQMIVGEATPALLVLVGAVGLVLLIACANIANLLLARATSRSREMAVRTMLGAGRARIVRQLLSESAVLGLLGGAAGIATAFWGVPALSALLPPELPRVNAIRVDGSVLGFALLLSAVASLAFGLAPAWFAADARLHTSLQEGGPRGGEAGSRPRARFALAAAEIALAMVLLVAAGLMLRSFDKLLSVTPGFDVRYLLKADVSLPRFRYSAPQQWTRFSDELLERLQAEPGLKESAVVVPRPLADRCVTLGFDVVGRPAPTASASRTAEYISVSRDYFRVMGIPLLAGRTFDRRDVSSSPRVSIISQAMARLHFPNEDPLGQRITFAFPPGVPGVEHEIVGIVGDVRAMALAEEPGPMMYVPYAQEPFWGANLVIRSALSPASVAATIRREVARLDKDLPVTDVATMPEVLAGSTAQPRFRTLLLGLFAAMAVSLAATGIFGVISYSVSCRTSEIGIRVALGATRAAILKLVLRDTLVLTLAGLAVGILCALAAGRLLEHMLFDVSPHDPATLAAVALALSTIAFLAGYLPARRATRVDATIALRHD
jgi:putative ABC transport system permease protein